MSGDTGGDIWPTPSFGTGRSSEGGVGRQTGIRYPTIGADHHRLDLIRRHAGLHDPRCGLGSETTRFR